MMEVVIDLLKVLVVLAAFIGLMYANWRYTVIPAPFTDWARAIIAIILIIVALVVMLSWVFHMSMPA